MLALISAPSNPGLRPPQPSSVPGTAKAPEALVARTRNQDALLEHAGRLAERIGEQLGQGRAPLVLGGDCSLLIGAGRALSARGRYGLIHLDGHTDFRHPGNSAECRSLAGEDLADGLQQLGDDR